MDVLKRILDEQFGRLHERSLALVRVTPADILYRQSPRDASLEKAGAPVYSLGEHVLRSAGAVEQTFGGVTANLWDDPFEWTLPESMPTPESVAEYLDEAEQTRQRGFALVHSDQDFYKEIAVPSGEMQTLCELFVATLARAAHHQGRAFATFRLFSAAPFPRD